MKKYKKYKLLKLYLPYKDLLDNMSKSTHVRGHEFKFPVPI